MRNFLLVVVVLIGCTSGFKHRRFVIQDITNLECTVCKCVGSCHMGESEDRPGVCKDSWGHIDCTDSVCKSYVCNNGGKCVATEQDGRYTASCQCTSDFSGYHCETNLNVVPMITSAPDMCLNNPCVHGKCASISNGYQCTCESGWSGTNCDIVQTTTTTTTAVPDLCAANPCVHGTCTKLTNGYICSCDSGWQGLICDTAILPCDSNPCQNGGKCLNLGTTAFTCACPTGWNGTTCQNAVNLCDSSPCQNGGQCLNLGTFFSCVCADGYAGVLCEKDAIPQCDPICALEAVARLGSVFNTAASQCSDNSTASNEALAMTCCSLNNQVSWLKGIQVMSHCTSTAQIPANTPIASFRTGRAADDTAGVFLACDGNGFKYVRQSCNSTAHLITVDGSGLDPASFFVVY